MAEQSKGFTCECGEKHQFAVYVFAHWDEELIHTCQSCQRQHWVLRGHVGPVRTKRRKAKNGDTHAKTH